MSFILDALKKSESDRQRQSGPSLFEVKVAPPRRALPIWAVAIAVLLGINIIVISWMLLRRPAAAQPPAAPASAPAAHGAPAARAAITPPASQASPTDSGQTVVAAPPAAAGAATQPAAQPDSTDRAAAPTARASGDHGADQPSTDDNPSDNAPAVEPAGTPGFATSGGANPAGGMPLYQQIATSDGLPSLHLDMHVFADRPQDRFVMINMHKLGEGDTLPGGVHVDTIRPDGVVLSYQGTQFLLPRN
jgi:general secretion pathway protein B